MVLSHRWPHCR